MTRFLRNLGRRLLARLPEWAERSVVIRSVVLLKELVFVDRPAHFYGQYAEDVLIDRLFASQVDGVFVDVGCFHPFRYNNTYLLYRRGWRGVNIDLDEVKIAGFRWLRGNDINICCAITGIRGTVPYYTPGAYSIVASLDREHVQSFHHHSVRRVAAQGLDDVLAQTPYRDREIDLLNVDAEGHDLDVLQTLDFLRYRPKVVVVESFTSGLRELEATDLYRFLTDRGYSMVQWAGLSVIFALRPAPMRTQASDSLS